MDLSIFKQEDKSGKFSKIKYLEKNHPEELSFILNHSKENGLEGLPFKEKVYLAVNNIKSVPTCKNINCSKKTNYKNSTLGYLSYCSNKCMSSCPDILRKKEQTSMKNYGTKRPQKLDIIKEKATKTNIERYGSVSPMGNNEVLQKSKNTLYENYGVYNPAHSEEILEKRIKSFKKSSYKETYRKTSLERYGVEHPWMSKDIHKKTIEHHYEYYRKRINEKLEKYSEYSFIEFEKFDDYTNLIMKCNKCDEEFKIKHYQFYHRVNSRISICTNCFPISDSSSISQIDIVNFIKDNYDGEILENVKDKIKRYEIDIYLPEFNLGIEFNGVHWYSTRFKNKDYHKVKQELANENNINLITIWEDEWFNKREICESFILNKIGKSSDRIYARNCIVKEVSYKESRYFLNDNHLQGDCKSSIRLGLYYNGELVSLMAFSKLRIAVNSKNKNGHYELTRFCNRINSSVIGGASKLFSYFKNNYDFDVIETYSDNLISNGYLYEKLGFKNIHNSRPGFWYLVDGVRKHRFNYRKSKLIEMGYDPIKTGEEIMAELGHFKIYNAGNKKWIFTL
jgi:hypothetical protein